MKYNNSAIPADRRFLSGVSSVRLRSMHKKETDPRAAARLLAYAMRKEGMSIRQICRALNRSYSTVRDWLVRAAQLGTYGRYDIKNKGAPNKLDPEQTKQLRADLLAGPRSCGFESGVWTAPLLAAHIRKKFGVQYATVSIYDILHRMGFSCRKPRPKHPKSASESEKKEFKKKAEEIIRSHPDHTVITVDEASFIIGWNTKNGWYLKGKPVTTPVSLSRKRFYSFGALYDGGFDCRFYAKANSYSFVDMLGHLHLKHGKIIVFLDNASYHKSKMVNDFVDSYDGDIVLVYLPVYTPELNTTEGQWRLLRRATANVMYESTKVMKESIWTMLDRREVKITRMSGYLS